MRALVGYALCLALLGTTDTAHAKKKKASQKAKQAEQTAPIAPSPRPTTPGPPVAQPVEPPATQPVAPPVTQPPPPQATPAPPGPASPPPTAAEAATAPPPAPSPSAEQLNVFGIPMLGIDLGLKIGGSIPTSKLKTAFLFGVDAAYHLPWLDDLLAAGLEFTYAQPSLSATATSAGTGTYSYTLNQRVISLALEGQVHHPLGPVNVYGALGYGIYFLRAETTVFGNTQDASQTRSGIQARGGAGYRLGPGDLFAELRWSYVQLRFRETGSSNAGAFLLDMGYRLPL